MVCYFDLPKDWKKVGGSKLAHIVSISRNTPCTQDIETFEDDKPDIETCSLQNNKADINTSRYHDNILKIFNYNEWKCDSTLFSDQGLSCGP